MFKKIISLALLVSIFSIASSLSVFAQASLSEAPAIMQNKSDEKKSDDLRAVIWKKEERSSASNFDEKDSLTTYQKQKSQGKRFSTGTKILIGVAIAAGLTGIFYFAASRDKIKPF